jgi:hypothetical protein
MYREKLINYIEKSPDINFIINLPGEDNSLAMVNFVKDNDEYFAKVFTVVKEDNNYEKKDFLFKDNLNDIGEDTLKVFVERWETMIVKSLSDEN